jgi:hypothetical protein
MSAIQDDASKGTTVEESTTPWWVEGWYWPGVWLGGASLAGLGVAPWTGDNCARVVGSALALLAVAVGLTILFAVRSIAYDATAKKVEEAEREVRIEWDRERNWEHCENHCSCSFCRTRRQQNQKAITS